MNTNMLWNAETIWTVWCGQKSCPHRAIMDDVLHTGVAEWDQVITEALYQPSQCCIQPVQLVYVCTGQEWGIKCVFLRTESQICQKSSEWQNTQVRFVALTRGPRFQRCRSEYIGCIEPELSSFPSLFLALLLWSCPWAKKREPTTSV